MGPAISAKPAHYITIPALILARAITGDTRFPARHLGILVGLTIISARTIPTIALTIRKDAM